MQSIDNNSTPRLPHHPSTTQPPREYHPACAACKHQRKKCDEKCIFAPHFPSTSLENFKKVHRVFGVNNIAKMMTKVPEECRDMFVRSLVWEAMEREANPIEGSFAKFNQMEKKNKFLKHENKFLRSNLQLYKNCCCSRCAYYNNHNATTNDQDYNYGNNDGDLYGNIEKEIMAGSISRVVAHSSNRVGNFGVASQLVNRNNSNAALLVMEGSPSS